MSYVLSRKAAEDLADILWFTRMTWGDTQAVKYKDQLVRAFELLSDFPGAGRVRSGANREFVCGSHVILYRDEPEGVVIRRLLHAARRR